MLISWIARFIFEKILGWSCADLEYTKKVSCGNAPSCIITVMNHTSNWDALLALLATKAYGFGPGYMMIKQEWMDLPIPGWSWLMEWFRFIPVDRSSPKASLEKMHEKLHMCGDKWKLAIAPEGTRAAVQRPKPGFYKIARKMKVPLILTAWDYKDKKLHQSQPFYTSGNYKEDLQVIRMWFVRYMPKHIENSWAHQPGVDLYKKNI